MKVIAVGLLTLVLVGCARVVGTGGGAQAAEESLEVIERGERRLPLP